MSGLSGPPNRVVWHHTLDSVPRDTPSLYIAHELFDALPAHQFVRDERRGWLEKMVDIDEGGGGLGSDSGGTQRELGRVSSFDGVGSPRLNNKPGETKLCLERLNEQNPTDAASGLIHADGSKPRAPQKLILPQDYVGPETSSPDPSSSLQTPTPGGLGEPLQPARFRMVLSPTRTPASVLLVPRRLGARASGAADPAGTGGGSTPPPATMAESTQPLEPPSSPNTSNSHPLLNDEAAAASPAMVVPHELEVSARAMAAAEALAVRVGAHGGAALIIDYGERVCYQCTLLC